MAAKRVFILMANVKALAQMGRGEASIAGKTPKLLDDPRTRPPHLLSSSVLFCSAIFYGGGEPIRRTIEPLKPTKTMRVLELQAGC